jgi:tRNA (cytidine32/uridine32-2'-O)-methyltransferase
MLDNVQIILLNTTHPGNIGAAARAMKTMGLKHLILVNPQATFPSADITARAAGADSILESTRVCTSLAEAVQGAGLVVGTSAEERSMPLKRWTARECAEAFAGQYHAEKIALVFGTERSGMSNEELALCHRQVVIPTHPDYTSLNLAAAVQVLCYEIFVASWAAGETEPVFYDDHEVLATQAELDGFYSHFEETLTQFEFITEGVDKKIMPRLKRFFQRAMPEQREINLWRGILKAARKNFTPPAPL